MDGCPGDPDKIDPGLCGCGVSVCWAAVDSGTDETLESVDFPVDDQTGYVSGGSGTLLKTVDGGLSWVALNPNVALDLETVDFPADTTTGYVVGDAGRILPDRRRRPDLERTAFRHRQQPARGLLPRGQWDRLRRGRQRNDPQDHKRWQRVDGADLQYDRAPGVRPFPTNGSIGFIAGRDGTILKTTNGGVNWQIQSTPTVEDLEAVYFPVDNLTGYVVGTTASC